MNNPKGKSSPVFLIGCGRSGTNMVTRGIARSFEVELYNEDNPAAFKRYRIKEFETIEQLNDAGYARINLFKPILDTHMANAYLSYFKNARIIFFFRHYDDVINSSIKIFGPDNWPARVKCWIEDSFSEFNSAPPPEITKNYIESRWDIDLSAQSAIALYWLFYNRLYFDLGLDRDERAISANYEIFVTKPEAEFHRICEFLSIKYTSEMIDSIFSTSIKRDTSPRIEESLRRDCDYLWERLMGTVEQNR